MRALGLALAVAAGVFAGCDREIAGGQADGAAIYSEVCSRCHGPGGIPDASMVARLGVKDLTSDRVQQSFTDADLRRQILRGSDNKQMPSFEGALSDEQIEAVIRHVRTLSSPRPQG